MAGLKILKKEIRGLTIVELLMVVVLLEGIFLIMTSAYLGGLKYWNNLYTQPGRVESYAAIEEMARRIGLANSIVLSADGKELKLRWDYTLNTWQPNGTSGTSSYADDTWIIYRFMNNSLYKLAAGPQASEPAGITAVNQAGVTPVQSGLSAGNASGFTLVNPAGEADPTTVRIVLAATISGKPVTIQTSSMIGAKAKN